MAINIFTEIERLLQYGLQKQLIEKWDVGFARNQILEVLELNEWEETTPPARSGGFTLLIFLVRCLIGRKKRN